MSEVPQRGQEKLTLFYLAGFFSLIIIALFAFSNSNSNTDGLKSTTYPQSTNTTRNSGNLTTDNLPTSTKRQNATRTATVFNSICTGAPQVILTNNSIVQVNTFGEKLRVRSSPDFSDNEITRLIHGTKLIILEGPVCVEDEKTGKNYWFWKIQVDETGTIGWVAEGDTDSYYLKEIQTDSTSKTTPTSSSTTKNQSYICGDINRIRLSVGNRAVIVWDKVNMRSSPKVPDDYYQNIVLVLEEKVVVTIIDGPECAHDGTWWKVKTGSGDLGWVREYSDGNYLLAPQN